MKAYRHGEMVLIPVPKNLEDQWQDLYEQADQKMKNPRVIANGSENKQSGVFIEKKLPEDTGNRNYSRAGDSVESNEGSDLEASRAQCVADTGGQICNLRTKRVR